jgi:hypothetical protein
VDRERALLEEYFVANKVRRIPNHAPATNVAICRRIDIEGLPEMSDVRKIAEDVTTYRAAQQPNPGPKSSQRCGGNYWGNF